MKQIARIHHLTQDLPATRHAEQAQLACQGGISWVQFRAKQASGAELVALAQETQRICKAHKAAFIINDHVAVARLLKADGVHLGKSDMSPEEARATLGPYAIIGGTANTFEDIRRLAKAAVDYIGIGPFRFTATKDNLSPVLGLEGYQELVAQCKAARIRIPMIAIGGITVEDAAAIWTTGIHGIAVSSAINLAQDPGSAAQAFSDTLHSQSATL